MCCWRSRTLMSHQLDFVQCEIGTRRPRLGFNLYWLCQWKWACLQQVRIWTPNHKHENLRPSPLYEARREPNQWLHLLPSWKRLCRRRVFFGKNEWLLQWPPLCWPWFWNVACNHSIRRPELLRCFKQSQENANDSWYLWKWNGLNQKICCYGYVWALYYWVETQLWILRGQESTRYRIYVLNLN